MQILTTPSGISIIGSDKESVIRIHEWSDGSLEVEFGNPDATCVIQDEGITHIVTGNKAKTLLTGWSNHYVGTLQEVVECLYTIKFK